MDRTSRAASPSWGYNLRQTLGGYFTAHARGLLATKFALMTSEGEEFGRLSLSGPSDAEFTYGSSVATFEASGRHYRMVANGEQAVVAGPKERSINALAISCARQNYEARISSLHNLALAHHAPGGERTVRLSGGLTARRYEAIFADDDGCALPIALFLLWHVVANRRRVYRAGIPTKGETM
jgi:hypothetical protein